MTLKDDFAAKSPITFVYGADGRVCATQRRISSSAVPLYSALMGLNSPRLPKVISVREDDEGAVVTEGYIDGVTLRRALDNGRLGEDELRRLAIDICSALSLLHSSRPPIIHRDIKPENIICADGGGYVLIDFDASRLFKPEATSDTVTLGTNGYAAPEQYGFGQTGPESDIYSLGAVPVILALLLGFCSGLAAGRGVRPEEEAQTRSEAPPTVETAVETASSDAEIPCTCELITRPNDARLDGHSMFDYPGAEFLPKSVSGVTEFPLTLDIKVLAPVYSKECKAKVHTAQHWEYSVPKGQEGETITGDKITVDGPGEYYIFYYCPDFNGTGYGADFGFKVR